MPFSCKVGFCQFKFLTLLLNNSIISHKPSVLNGISPLTDFCPDVLDDYK